MYIRITNNNCVDPNAFRLLGATSKRDDDSKIGFFGTGNKYALAWLLRNGCEVVVFSGNDRITITSQPETFRDQTVNVIHVNDAPTSITDDMGPQWKAWEVLRELYSNAIDEGGESIELSADLVPVGDSCTAVYVTAIPELLSAYGDFSHYFILEREPLWKKDGYAIYPSKKGALYRHGILVSDGDTDTFVFDYENKHAYINEMRRAIFPRASVEDVVKAVFEFCNDTDVVWPIMKRLADKTAIESHINISSSDFFRPSEAFLSFFDGRLVACSHMQEQMSDSELSACTVIPGWLYALIMSIAPERVTLPAEIQRRRESSVPYGLVQPTVNESKMIVDSIAVLKFAGFEVEYPVDFVEFYNKDHLAMADSESKRILISKRCLSMGSLTVISALIEEVVHLRDGVKDETRAMQDSLCNAAAGIAFHCHYVASNSDKAAENAA